MNQIELFSDIFIKKLENTPEKTREIFSKLVKTFKNYNLVLIGLRQVGKTTVAEQLINHFRKKNKQISDDSIDSPSSKMDKDVIYLNLKSFFNFQKKDTDDIFKHINEMKPKYCLLDEIQIIDNWSSFCQSIIDANPNTKFIITGSNALSLSNETMFNRVKIFLIKPLSWKEYKNIWEKNDLKDYLYFGSYPPSNNNSSPQLNYTNMVEDHIIDKIVADDTNGFLTLVKFKQFMAKIKNYIGNEITISKDFDSVVSRPTVKEYINLLINSKLINRVWKYKDTSSKPKSKLYFQDKSMIHWMNNYDDLNNNEHGSFIENLVFNQLDFWFNYKYQIEEIFYYKQEKEIDFIIPKHKILIEVKFVNDLNVEEELKKYCEISKDFNDYRKIMITNKIKEKRNDWELIPLEDFLEMEKNDLL